MTPGDVPQWVILPWLFAFGAVIGSFLNVCIYRLPRHDRLWDQLSGLTHPPSACPFCGRGILAIDNIPIFGWLFLRGRCRFCRHSIPARYALIEFFNGLLWVLLYVAIVPAGFGAKIDASWLWSFEGPLAPMGLSHEQLVWRLHAMYFYYLVMVEALVVATFIDIDLQIIPDGSTVPAMIVAVIGSVAIGNLQLWPIWFQDPIHLHSLSYVLPPWMHWLWDGPARPAWIITHPHLHGLAASVAGAVVGGGIVWLVRVIGRWAWKREVMGDGDVVLMAMIGSFMGWQPAIMVFFLAPFCGLAVTLLTLQFLRHRELAYGPYISAAALIVLFGWRLYFARGDYLFELGFLIPIVAVVMIVLMAASLVFIRQIRLLLGFRDFDFDEYHGEWTSADQLAFYANKDYESGRGGLQAPNWPGQNSGQGRQFADRWRNGR